MRRAVANAYIEANGAKNADFQLGFWYQNRGGFIVFGPMFQK
ncbi:hypothetical protein RB2150_13066 [Rhodobacteraceae bacterium HTCC2150]|nr:hypothetical protein RB2150_13066 [Rhodobacteraceae bacterium HTCC2150]